MQHATWTPSPHATPATEVPPRMDLSLYLVTDSVMAGSRSLADVVAPAVAAGVTCVQLREKAASDEEVVALGRQLVEVLAGTGVPLLIDDRVHLVHPIGADGVHIGQEDTPPTAARAALGPEAIIGLSVHDAAQVDAANALPPATLDYIGLGPVWATGTKEGHAPPIGPEGLADLRRRSHHPAVAIGGVKAHTLAELAGSGVEGVAVVSAICAAADVPAATRELREALATSPLQGEL